MSRVRFEYCDILGSPHFFVASANCAIYCGAEVDFVDIDLDTINICVESCNLNWNKRATILKILVVVHMCGTPATGRDT